MAKERLRNGLSLAVAVVGLGIMSGPLLETQTKPQEERTAIVQENKTRYTSQAFAGAALAVVAADYLRKRKFDKSGHLLLMWTPNFLNPNKLASNMRHPVFEVTHTSHVQYKMEEGAEYYVVEHKVFRKVVTVDIVEPSSFERRFVPRIKQLFDRSFYYGHAEYFPKPFKLVNRTFVRKGFDKKMHLQKFKKYKS